MEKIINEIRAKEMMLSKLEDMVECHIKMYPDRHLPCTESSYILNESAILKLGDAYREIFNKNPKVTIYELDFYLKGN